MAKENGALPGLLPVVLGFLEIDNGHCCGKTDIRACSGVGAQVDQREGHEMSATQILQIAEWTIADRGKEYDSTKGERSGATQLYRGASRLSDGLAGKT